jgi:flagellar basal body rod protein FlgF
LSEWMRRMTVGEREEYKYSPSTPMAGPIDRVRRLCLQVRMIHAC